MITAQALIEKFKYALENDWGYIWGTAGIKWTEAKQNQATREQTVTYGRKWIGHYVADCSGLFSWAFKQLGGYMYHGSNTMYKSYCTAKGALKGGKRTDGGELKPGTAIFTGTEGEHGHVGLYIGGGYVIEAAGTKDGVIKTAITKSKWTWWGELKGVEYGGGSDPKPEPEPADEKPTLRRGDKGSYVTLAQTMLNNKGYDLGSCGVDGDFGSATERAVKQFQKDHGLTADGVIGPKTWAKLDEQGTNLYTVTIPHLTKFKAEALIKDYAGASMTEEGG